MSYDIRNIRWIFIISRPHDFAANEKMCPKRKNSQSFSEMAKCVGGDVRLDAGVTSLWTERECSAMRLATSSGGGRRLRLNPRVEYVEGGVTSIVSTSLKRSSCLTYSRDLQWLHH